MKQYRGGQNKICPMCDKVVQYLTTHLQRTHRLDRQSEQYEFAMQKARKYQGAKEELKWDSSIVKAKRRRAQNLGYEEDVVVSPKKKNSHRA